MQVGANLDPHGLSMVKQSSGLHWPILIPLSRLPKESVNWPPHLLRMCHFCGYVWSFCWVSIPSHIECFFQMSQQRQLFQRYSSDSVDTVARPRRARPHPQLRPPAQVLPARRRLVRMSPLGPTAFLKECPSRVFLSNFVSPRVPFQHFVGVKGVFCESVRAGVSCKSMKSEFCFNGVWPSPTI